MRASFLIVSSSVVVATTAALQVTPDPTLVAGTPGTRTHGKLTIRVEDIPADAAPHWPWEDQEDFFTWSGLAHTDLVKAGVQKCTSPNADSKVYTVSDGENERCFVAIKSLGNKKASPILFFAHGSGGSAYQCGNQPDQTGKKWSEVAEENGFILVCGEAVQSNAINNITGSILTGGKWVMPEVINDSSGRYCEPNDAIENKYMTAIWDKMNSMSDSFDTSRSFITGCSEGSAFAQWQGVCRHLAAPKNYTAFATHSTGLKVKGDGNQFPPCPQDPEYTWGECPKCEYWPTLPGSFPGLRACIFDNKQDPNAQDPFFYDSSVQMAKYYDKFNNDVATSYGEGGHCVQHSFMKIAECMDNGSGRLLVGSSPSGNCTDEAPDTNYTCAQQASFGKCTKPWMDGFCCKTCFDCSASCSN